MARLYSYLVQKFDQFGDFAMRILPRTIYTTDHRWLVRYYHIIFYMLFWLIIVFCFYFCILNREWLVSVLLLRNNVLIFSSAIIYVKIFLWGSCAVLWSYIAAYHYYYTLVCYTESVLIQYIVPVLLALLSLIIILTIGSYFYYCYVFYIQQFIICFLDQQNSLVFCAVILALYMLSILLSYKLRRYRVGGFVYTLYLIFIVSCFSLLYAYISNPIFNWGLAAVYTAGTPHELHVCYALLVCTLLYYWKKFTVTGTDYFFTRSSCCWLTFLYFLALGARFGFKTNYTLLLVCFTDLSIFLLLVFFCIILYLYVALFSYFYFLIISCPGVSARKLFCLFLFVIGIAFIAFNLGLLCTMICMYVKSGVAVPVYTLAGLFSFDR